MSDLLFENQRLADFISRATVRIQAADDDNDDDVRVHVAAWEKVRVSYLPLVRSNQIKVMQYHLDTIGPLVTQMEIASVKDHLLYTSHTLVTALAALPGSETEIIIPHTLKT